MLPWYEFCLFVFFAHLIHYIIACYAQISWTLINHITVPAADKRGKTILTFELLDLLPPFPAGIYAVMAALIFEKNTIDCLCNIVNQISMCP
jgi:hypothetical protein